MTEPGIMVRNRGIIPKWSYYRLEEVDWLKREKRSKKDPRKLFWQCKGVEEVAEVHVSQSAESSLGPEGRVMASF